MLTRNERRRKRRALLTRVRLHQRKFGPERVAKLEAAHWRFLPGMRLAVPRDVAEALRELATRHGLPITVIVSAAVEVGLPHLGPSKVAAFWAQYRQIVGDVLAWRESFKDRLRHLRHRPPDRKEEVSA